MKYFFSFVLIFIGFINCSFSQNYKKGFDLIKLAKYGEANKIFKGILNKNENDAVANFGLALILSNNDYSQKDFILAFKYISIASKYYKNIKNEELLKIEKKIGFPLAPVISKNTEDIDNAVLEYLQKEQKPELIQRYFILCSESKYIQDVIKINYQIEFEKAKQVHTSEAYNLYLGKYPYAKECDNAIKRRDSLEYKYCMKNPFIWNFNKFITRYPKSALLDSIIYFRDIESFNLAKNANSMDEYDDFINRYPQSKAFTPQILKLRTKKAFESAYNKNSLEDIQAFIYNNPTAPQLERAVYKRDSLVFESIKSTINQNVFNNFLSNFPFAKQAFNDFLNNYSAYLNQRKEKK